jgi:hypothetical protein
MKHKIGKLVFKAITFQFNAPQLKLIWGSYESQNHEIHNLKSLRFS